MSRFPGPFEMAARRAEHERSAAVAIVSAPLRYGRCCRVVMPAQAPAPIVDRDPGGEDDGVRARGDG